MVLTVTLKEHEELPHAFVAVQVTVVVPTEKAEPDAGVHETAGEGVPVAVGVVHVAIFVLHCTISVGHAPITAGMQATISQFTPL